MNERETEVYVVEYIVSALLGDPPWNTQTFPTLELAISGAAEALRRRPVSVTIYRQANPQYRAPA